MDNKKTDSYYIDKITSDLSFILLHSKGLSKEQIEENEILIDSIMFRLIQISENCSKLTVAFKKEHSEIPWHALRALRNKIVHEYGGVDFLIVYKTIKEDIPALLGQLKAVKI